MKTDARKAESGPARSSLAGDAGFWAALGARLIINTARRFPYPFAPALSRGLGVPLPAVTAILGANQFSGLACLVFGPLGDRKGYRTLMLAGLITLILGLTLAGAVATYAAVFAGLVLAGMAKNMYDPAVLAYTKTAIRNVKDMDVAQSYDYLMAKSIALVATDPNKTREKGLEGFLDKKTYRPGFGAVDF